MQNTRQLNGLGLIAGSGPDGVSDRLAGFAISAGADDLLILNDTRVSHVASPLAVSGGRVELLVMPDVDTLGRYWAMAKPARRLRAGEQLEILSGFGASASKVAGCAALLGERRADGCFAVELMPSPDVVMGQAGKVPIPPYLNRESVEEDAERYQTVFGTQGGAVAAPTAGLHFTQELLQHLSAVGCRRAWVTLHVGAGTFRSLRPTDLIQKRLHRALFCAASHGGCSGGNSASRRSIIAGYDVDANVGKCRSVGR